MVHLYLVRHGETEENVAGILQGHMPGLLTERGREQARQLRDTLRGTSFDALYVSDLRRTLQTAEILNEALRLPLVEEPLLRERDWGELTGRRIADIDTHSFPPSVESVEGMFRRAALFLNRLLREHDGEKVLAISHGLFSRALQACYHASTIHDTPRMANGEVRHIEILHPVMLTTAEDQETGASAD